MQGARTSVLEALWKVVNELSVMVPGYGKKHILCEVDIEKVDIQPCLEDP
jgi:hypothetical protein